MMEIPAGRLCIPKDVECPFLKTDVVETQYCGVFLEEHGLQWDYSGSNCSPVRCTACLSAYPNGGTITITSKETA